MHGWRADAFAAFRVIRHGLERIERGEGCGGVSAVMRPLDLYIWYR